MVHREAKAARALMASFAERSGLSSERTPVRYLWTDAFAVCNWLALGDHELALQLINQVHHTLGRYRDDDPRRGWLSGLDSDAGEAHPTQGGLRIGKDLPERASDEAFDERLEWDRDGQYFHYLTKWMHALDQVARSTGQPLFNLWGRELAVRAHQAFVYRTPGRDRPALRMYWKMSSDLSRPLVESMGHHDPIDGLITCAQLEESASRFPDVPEPRLVAQVNDFQAMVPDDLATPDPLGLGGLLADAYRVAQLTERGAALGDDLLERILAAALLGLRHYVRSNDRRRPADHRLAFRELGLAIGLAAIPPTRERHDGKTLDELAKLVPLRDEITSFWQEPKHRETSTWLDHANINDVMLATSLAPQGYLRLH